MSIIPGRKNVRVIPMIKTRDPQYNGWKLTRGVPVEVKDCTVQPFGVDRMSRAESPDEPTVDDQFTVRGRGVWPGGVKSIVEIDGEEYDQVGIAKRHTIGIYTKHFFVRVQLRKAEVK